MRAKLLITGCLLAGLAAGCDAPVQPVPQHTFGQVLELYQRCTLVPGRTDGQKACNTYDILWMDAGGAIWTLSQEGVPPVWKGFRGEMVLVGGRIWYARQR